MLLLQIRCDCFGSIFRRNKFPIQISQHNKLRLRVSEGPLCARSTCANVTENEVNRLGYHTSADQLVLLTIQQSIETIGVLNVMSRCVHLAILGSTTLSFQVGRPPPQKKEIPEGKSSIANMFGCFQGSPSLSLYVYIYIYNIILHEPHLDI